jgi:signal transduction histidine kinase
VLLLVPLVLTAVIACRGAADAEQRVEDDRLALAQATTLTASAFIGAHIATVRALSRSPDVTDIGSRPDPRGFLAKVLADTQDWESIELFQADGWSVIGAGADTRTLNIADRPYFQEALIRDGPVIGPATAGRRTPGSTIPLAVRVDFVNSATGVLIVWVSTARLDAAVSSISKEDRIGIALLDSTGKVFVRSGSQTPGLPSPTDGATDIATVRQGESTVERIEDESGIGLLVASSPVVDTGWTALVIQPLSAAFGPIRQQLRDQLVSLSVAAAAIAAIALYLSRRYSRSFETQIDAMRRVDQFISAASHDLKTPLTVIKTMAQLIRRRLGSTDLPDKVWFDESLASIDTAVVKMTAQINELLDVSRLQHQRALDLDLRPTDLVGLVRRTANEQQQTTTAHTIQVEATSPRMVGRFDPGRIERVIANLIGNAIKYSPDGGQIQISMRRERLPVPVTTTDAAIQPEWAVITVQDQGIGIPSADLPYVFERFHRAENAAGRTSGSGIGLAGARQIVEQHGGTITVESVEGKGSIFTVRLPLQQRRLTRRPSAA